MIGIYIFIYVARVDLLNKNKYQSQMYALNFKLFAIHIIAYFVTT